jgi:hypothetical protein
VACLRCRCLQAGQRGTRAFQLGQRQRLVQLGHQTCFPSPACEIECFALRIQTGDRDGKALLAGAQFDIVARHFGQQRDPGIAQAFRTGLQIGFRGFDATASGTENVRLPTGIEGGAEQVAAGAAAGFSTAVDAPGVARGGDGRRQTGTRQIPSCARFPKLAARGRKIGIGDQRVDNQPVEHRIAELRPPAGKLLRIAVAPVVPAVPPFGNG